MLPRALVPRVTVVLESGAAHEVVVNVEDDWRPLPGNRYQVSVGELLDVNQVWSNPIDQVRKPRLGVRGGLSFAEARDNVGVAQIATERPWLSDGDHYVVSGSAQNGDRGRGVRAGPAIGRNTLRRYKNAPGSAGVVDGGHR